MSKIIFTNKEIKLLQKNPNVQSVSSLAITYTENFKNKFMDEYLAGKFPRQIFEEHGFDINILGVKRIEQSAYRWKKAYEKDGLIGPSDVRKTASGRPLKRELSQSEIIERQEARIKLLEGQVELLKKLETTERRLLNKSQNLETSKIIQLIHETMEQNEFKQMSKYFCELLGVSRSGYYSFLKAADTRLERDALCSLIDKKVENSEVTDDRKIKISFENSVELVVPLEGDENEGFEAAILHIGDSITVW